MLHSLCPTIGGAPYCLVINPHCREEVIHKGSLIGQASLVIPETQGEEVGALGEGSLTRKEKSYRRSFLIEKLRLKENPKLQDDPELMEKVLGAFEDNWEAVSTGEFDYGHTTAIRCQIQLKPGQEEPIRLRARPLNPRQEEGMKEQLEESEKVGVIEKTQSPWAFPMVGVKKKDSD